ncbi:MAG: site-specific DNA-methyltransferase [Pedobacter sp.]
MPALHWIGKDKVVKHHHEVPFKILQREYVHTAPEGSPVNSIGNRIIHGDNLEALKALLPEYEGRVKCIYIDPPYNTGNEGWVYNDNVNEPRIQKWLHQVVGKEGEDLTRHDKWLCMMYPRLKLLHRLLANDGVIFVSIDENEHRYFELLIEEIFGSVNKIETFIWKKSYGGGAKSKHIVNLHEFIVCFAKNKDSVGALDLPPDEKALKYYKYKDEKFAERGPYRFQPLATNSMDERPNLRYPITFEGEDIWPEKQWQWSRDRVETAQNNNELAFTQKSGKWTVSYKQYLKSTNGNERRSKAYSIIDGIYTQQGTNEIKAMFGDGKIFSFPKPSYLITYLLQLVTDQNALVLDSFGGSGTTAHAVLKLNAQDGGNRKFILTEMMDYAETITAERVRRVMGSYGEEAKAVAGLGGSFEYYTIGAALFDEDGNLNEAVPVDEIRRYVAYSEGIECRSDRQTLLGISSDAAYFFHYEPDQAQRWTTNI